jgi:2-isopropylmalate synthase
MAEDSEGEHRVQIDVTVEHERVTRQHGGQGNGPIDAFVAALGLDIRLMDYHEHAIGSGADAKAACYVELRLGNGPTLFGAAIDSNIVTASFKAVLSAVNRQIAQAQQQPIPRAA